MKKSTMSRVLRGLLAVALMAGLSLQAACAITLGKPAETAAPQMEEPMQAEPSEDIDATQPDEATESTDARAQLTGFTTKDLAGNTVTESVFGNAKVTMLNVWATFCGPCLNEMPDLGELSKEYADKGLQIVGLVSDVSGSEDGIAAVQKIIDSTGANYTQLFPSKELEEKLLSQMMYVPTTIFFDENGYQLGEMVVGSNSKADWQKLFDSALAEAAAE